MGTVEQDLARHDREQDWADQLDAARTAIFDEIMEDRETLGEFMRKAWEDGRLQPTTIAKMMTFLTEGRQDGRLSESEAETLVEIYDATDPYLDAEIEKRLPMRLEQWRREEAEAKLYGDGP